MKNTPKPYHVVDSTNKKEKRELSLIKWDKTIHPSLARLMSYLLFVRHFISPFASDDGFHTMLSSPTAKLLIMESRGKLIGITEKNHRICMAVCAVAWKETCC